MRRLAETLITSFVVFLATLISGALLEYFTQIKGSITTGPQINTDIGLLFPVDIDNYRNSSIDDLKIMVPINVQVNKINSSIPLKISVMPDNVNLSTFKMLTFSGFEGNLKTRILFPMDSKNMAIEYKVINAKDKKLKMLPTEGISDPLNRAIEDAITFSVIYSLFFGIFWYKYLGEKEKTHKKLDELIETSSKLESKMVNEIKDGRNRVLRLKIYLLARINDYAIELSFWRNSVSKILIQSGKDEKYADKLIEKVSESLKTQSTNSDIFSNFKTIETMATLISSAEKESSKDR